MSMVPFESEDRVFIPEEWKEFFTNPLNSTVRKQVFAFVSFGNRTVCVAWKKEIDAAIFLVWTKTLEELKKEKRMDLSAVIEGSCSINTLSIIDFPIGKFKSLLSIQDEQELVASFTENLLPELSALGIFTLENAPKNAETIRAWTEERIDALKSPGIILFQCLDKRLTNVQWRMIGQIPCISEVPKRLKQDEDYIKDQDLKKVFEKGLLPELRKLGAFEAEGVTEPTNAEEIRLFFADPENKQFLNQITILNLKGLRLKTCPQELSRLKKLVILDLSNNLLRNFSLDCRKLTQLQEIHLTNNKIESFTADLSCCGSLVKLIVSKNSLKEFSSDISECLNLKIIDLSQNLICTLSLDLRKLFLLEELYLDNNTGLKDFSLDLRRNVNLKALSLNCCGLTSFTADLSKNVKLQKLLLSRNQMQIFSSDLSACTQLETLLLNKNELTEFKADLRSPLLETIDLSCNQLTDFSVKEMNLLVGLNVLDLGNNKIKYINVDISQCSLTNLFLIDNLLTILPLGLERLYSSEEDDLGLGILNNPFLFLWRDFEATNSQQVISRYEKCKNYTCLSAFSNLCQKIINGADVQAIQGLFEELKESDQTLILSMMRGLHSTLDLELVKANAFNDMHAFNTGLREAIHWKFTQSPELEQELIKKHAREIAGLDAEADISENVLLLIDAMDQVEEDLAKKTF